jgi:hypothetical protein
VLRPGETITAIKAAFRVEKAGALVRLAKDVGRIGEKAGTRGALDTLRIAQGPKDVARAAGGIKGGQTAPFEDVRPRCATLATGGFSDDVAVPALLALFGSVVDQGDHGAVDDGVAAPESAAATQAGPRQQAWDLAGWRCRTPLDLLSLQTANSFPQKYGTTRCRVFTTALLKLPISTKARAIPFCSYTASPRPRM